MKKTLMIMLLAGAAMTPSLILTAGNAGAAPRDRYDRYDRYEKRDRAERRYYRSKRYRENEYTARANDLDPSREYGGYPDWARAALAPKYDGGTRR